MPNYKKYNHYFIYKLFYQYSAVYLRAHLNLEIVSVSKHFDRFYSVQDGKLFLHLFYISLCQTSYCKTLL